MSTIEHVTLSELQNLLQTLELPPDTRLTVTFENKEKAQKVLKRQKAAEAMKRLKGSGNGKLVTALLAERERDNLL